MRQPVDVDELEKHMKHPQRRNLAHLSLSLRASSSKHGKETLAFLEEIYVPQNQSIQTTFALVSFPQLKPLLYRVFFISLVKNSIINDRNSQVESQRNSVTRRIVHLSVERSDSFNCKNLVIINGRKR